MLSRVELNIDLVYEFCKQFEAGADGIYGKCDDRYGALGAPLAERWANMRAAVASTGVIDIQAELPALEQMREKVRAGEGGGFQARIQRICGHARTRP